MELGEQGFWAMRSQHSEFDRVKRHLTARGSHTPVSGETRDDLETLVRRYDEVRSLGREYGGVELSPYMSSLMRVSGVSTGNLVTAGASVAAGV